VTVALEQHLASCPRCRGPQALCPKGMDILLDANVNEVLKRENPEWCERITKEG